MTIKRYQTYKLLGILLTYPTDALIEALDSLDECVQDEKLLSHEHILALQKLIQWMKATDLLSLQENYVSLFDRQPLLSLHLFEHVFGDSRDRGQAMVDLKQRYEEQKLNLKEGELPDFLPVFLEHLSHQDSKVVSELLGEPINIIATLAERLHKHNSLYQFILNALLSLSTTKPNTKIVNKALENYKAKEPTQKEIDEQWAEEPVTFCGNKNPAQEEKIIHFEHLSKKIEQTERKGA